MNSEEDHLSEDEIKLFVYGQVACAMSAVWKFYGYQDYPASQPAVCSFKVRTPQQLKDIVKSGQISELQVYYMRPPDLEDMKYVDFVRTYNISPKLPIFHQNNSEDICNSQANEKHYFEINLENDIHAYIYIPVVKVDRCVCIEMLYRVSGEI